MANAQRLRRVADQIQKELAAIIAAELKDPRIALVTLTDVEVSPDLAHAKVFYTSLADAGSREALGAALTHAAGFLRSQLSRRIKLQGIPDLHFEYDLSIERGFAIDRLIDEAVSDTAEDGGAGDAGRRRPVSR